MRAAFRRRAGFTLIELMVVIFIMSVLAAVAIPSFMRYMRKAKSSEAPQNLRKIYEASRAYAVDVRVKKGSSEEVTVQFPVPQAITPGVSCCTFEGGKCAPNPAFWSTPTWDALRFKMDDRHYYRYEYISSGLGTEAAFTARALGDIDCDGVEATFEMYAKWTGSDVSGSAGMYKRQEAE